jgi:hypothetical protein
MRDTQSARQRPVLRLLPAVLAAVAALCLPVAAQTSYPPQGSWDPAFDHEFNTANTNQVVIPPLGLWPPTFEAVHMALIPVGPYRGMVLAWDTASVQLRPHQRWTIIDPKWTPTSGRPRFRNFFLAMPQTASTGDLFCSGHCWGRDGRLFVAGGTAMYPVPPTYFLGAALVYQFAPDLFDAGNQDFGLWQRETDLASVRWYPWVTLGADDSFLIAGGSDNSQPFNHYEVYRQAHPYQNPPAPVVYDQRILGTGNMRLYSGPGWPGGMQEYVRIHLLTNGLFFASGPFRHGFRWVHNPDDHPIYDFSAGGQATDPAILYGCHILDPRSGGQDNRIARIGGSSYGLTVTDVEWCYADGFGTGSDWQQAQGQGHLSHPRWMANAVILPSADVLMVGGFLDVGSPGTPELTPELLTPNGWVDQPQQDGARGYHSTAVLLPDARVLVAGADVRSHDYQIYNPPYLTSGRPRPKRVGCNIPPVPGGMKYRDDDPNALYTAWWDENLPAGVTVDKVVLMRPGSVTHHSDMAMRYLELDKRDNNEHPKGECRISFLPPKNSRYAPRGWYMLFLLTNEKVPSEAIWVHLE